ncbi:hypothetical protein [Acidipila sp. EB88]|uniref:hypothetical protein n=1 Tax=Acidipila sp. EB88 TaxID=2305226 RepID=UPI000F5F36DD|nr:hypothetical protein [Acidipila sp. EB88]RRA48456.1 hypothetical protein D1Y84_09300 [Acidipila sp. EB88]
MLLSDQLRVEVLPELGGKIASISLVPGGGELLQAPLRPYEARTPTLPFDQGDGGGWDECLPSVGPCVVEYGENGRAEIPDHGDFWRVPFTVDEATATTLRMHAEGTSLPVQFERQLTVDGGTLRLDYALRNTGTVAVPYGWSVHPLFAVEPFDRIHLPDSVREITAASSGDGRLGASGTRHAWPLTTNALDEQPLDLSLCGSHDDGVGDKLVMPAPSEGWCALERKTLRAMVTLRFDASEWPWLGLWICYGGWPSGPSEKKGYTVALEPCNLPDDALAASLAQGAGALLDAGETRRWTLVLDVGKAEER